MITDQTKKAMRMAISAQCTGMIALLLFNNGFILAYLSELGIQSGRILIYLSLPMLISFFLTMPFAFLSDRFGKKLFGTIGMIAAAIGYFFLTFAGSFPGKLANWAVLMGITIFGIGCALGLSSWYALLEPIVPLNIRGRFFGNLRLSWHVTSIIFAMIVAKVLDAYSTLSAYQVILSFVIILLIARVIFYVRIPEIEKPGQQKAGFRKSFMEVIGIPGYMPFCSYSFLLSLFTGACPWIFSLLEKDVLHFSESQIVLVGNLLFVGSIVGYYFGGKMIDSYGAKSMFFFCHLSFGAIIFLFVARDMFPFPAIVTAGFLTGCFGLVLAASGIAITTEMMALIPQENKSLSTSFNSTLLAAGITLSGIISGKVIELNVLNKSWILFGLTMSDFDTLLLACGIMIILLIITLGLVPSVIKKAEWIPQGK